MKAYEQVIDEVTGAVSFREIEVPDAAEVEKLKADKKKANDEAAKYRHEANRLKAATATTADAEDSDDSQSEAVVPPVKATAKPAPAAVIDEEAMAERAALKAMERMTAAQTAQAQADAEIAALLIKHGLPADYAEELRESRNPARLAETLGRDRLNFAPAHSGNKPRGDATLAAAVLAFREMGMVHPDDPENK